MNTIYTSSANALYAFNFELQDLCRICGASSDELNSMFDDNGSAYDFSSKINEYLPIRVQKSDYLPQKICSLCAATLLQFHQLYIVCQSTNTRFLQSLEGEAYEHHAVKHQVGGDPSELLELQSSFSREIENEILHMHESKEINEAESEIAANAAVKELERIGSAENISLVEDVVALNAIDEVDPVEEGTKNIDEVTTTTTTTEVKNAKKSNGSLTKGKAKKEIMKKKTKSKTLETKPKNNPKEKAQTATKSPKNGISKCLKEETLSKEPEKSTKTNERLTNGKSNPVTQETEHADEENETAAKKPQSKSEQITCQYCPQVFETNALMVGHIKDLHNDLIFHCEVCDDYKAREDLMVHMLGHVLNPITNETPFVATERKNESESPVDTQKANEIGVLAPAEGAPQKSNPNFTKENHQPSDKKHYCSDCDKTFADSGGFKYHINSFHRKIKKYQCDICKISFSCKRVITNHLRGVHMKERIFECNQCLKNFSTDSALYMHKKIHENVFKCVCPIDHCERKFRSMSKLKIHMTMHTKIKSFFCPTCERGFAVRNNLTKHMLTHSKSFDFKCTKCSYKANQRRYLAEHIKRAHKT